jgi:protein-S-isoprenylcysteine O-methyltransferase Ste14
MTAPGNRSSLAGFGVAVLVIAVLFTRQELFARTPIFIGIQLLALALMVWARITFGRRSFHAAASPTAGGLVTSGPYRWWRHPIYAAIIYFLWAGVADHRSPAGAALAAAATAGLVVRMVAEERFLRDAYGGYAAYAERARRIVPGIL